MTTVQEAISKVDKSVSIEYSSNDDNDDDKVEGEDDQHEDNHKEDKEGDQYEDKKVIKISTAEIDYNDLKFAIRTCSATKVKIVQDSIGLDRLSRMSREAASSLLWQEKLSVKLQFIREQITQQNKPVGTVGKKEFITSSNRIQEFEKEPLETKKTIQELLESNKELKKVEDKLVILEREWKQEEAAMKSLVTFFGLEKFDSGGLTENYQDVIAAIKV